MQEDLDHVAGLLEQHIKDYIEKIGGEENMQLLTDEELEEIWGADVAEVLQRFNWYWKPPAKFSTKRSNINKKGRF